MISRVFSDVNSIQSINTGLCSMVAWKKLIHLFCSFKMVLSNSINKTHDTKSQSIDCDFEVIRKKHYGIITSTSLCSLLKVNLNLTANYLQLNYLYIFHPSYLYRIVYMLKKKSEILPVSNRKLIKLDYFLHYFLHS